MSLHPLAPLRTLAPLTGPAPTEPRLRRWLTALQERLRISAGRSPLGRLYLAGARGPEDLRLILAIDGSGSMEDCTSARDAALRRFVPWAAANLRSGDELAVVDFATTSALRLSPTPLEHFTGSLPAAALLDRSDTRLHPVLRTASGMPSTGCRVALVLLSDAQLTDLPNSGVAGQRALEMHRIDDVRLLVPGLDIPVPGQWTAAFPMTEPVWFNGKNVNAACLAFARTLASLTGQSLANEEE
ncbi:hypothetical protein ACWGI8_04350 [Streptomyces sp. NPDC054841]